MAETSAGFLSSWARVMPTAWHTPARRSAAGVAGLSGAQLLSAGSGGRAVSRSVIGDHRRADGRAGALVYDDQAAGQPVAGVRVAEQRLGDPERHPADLVQLELPG